MKMMMISSLVETGGWGTPPIPGGGNKDTGVLKVEGDPVASAMVGEAVTPMEAIRGAGFASFPSHSTRSEIDQSTISEERFMYLHQSQGEKETLCGVWVGLPLLNYFVHEMVFKQSRRNEFVLIRQYKETK